MGLSSFAPCSHHVNVGGPCLTVFMSNSTFAPGSVHLVALQVVVARAERIELEMRRLEAERLQVFADAFDIAAAESERCRTHSDIPRGEGAELAYRSVRAELAAAFHLSEATIDRRLAHAYAMTRGYLGTLDALHEGLIAEQHARVIVEAGQVLDGSGSPEACLRRGAYEAAVLRSAVEVSPNRLRAVARRLAEQHAVSTMDERHARARKHRRVSLIDGEDGMADLIAHLPAVEAHAVYYRLTRVAQQIERCETGEQGDANETSEPSSTDVTTRRARRLRDEIRADSLVDLLLAGSGSPVEARPNGELEGLAAVRPAGVRAQVQVIISDELLFGELMRAERAKHRAQGRQTEQLLAEAREQSADTWHPNELDEYLAPSECLAELAGYGPIDTQTARELAASASTWELSRYQADSATVLSVDRYRPSEAMRRLLTVRDEHCRFPGCRAPVHRCDLDHTHDAAKGGCTATDNLGYLCRGHHTLKHHGGWRVKQKRAGVLEWRSPAGRAHRERPPSEVRFAAVKGVATVSN